MNRSYHILPVASEVDYRIVGNLHRWGYEFTVDPLESKYRYRLATHERGIAQEPELEHTYAALTNTEIEDHIIAADLILNMTPDQLLRRRTLEYERAQRAAVRREEDRLLEDGSSSNTLLEEMDEQLREQHEKEQRRDRLNVEHDTLSMSKPGEQE
jgi:hypothetical protein